MRLGEALIEKGLITEEDLAQALAEQFHLSYYPLDNFRMNPEFFKTIPVELMYRYPFVPYGEKEGSVVILVSDPTKMAAMDELEWIVKKKIIFGISSRTALLEALKRSEGSGQVLKEMQADFRPVLVTEDDSGEEVLSIEKVRKDASTVVKLFVFLFLFVF